MECGANAFIQMVSGEKRMNGAGQDHRLIEIQINPSVITCHTCYSASVKLKLFQS